MDSSDSSKRLQKNLIILFSFFIFVSPALASETKNSTVLQLKPALTSTINLDSTSSSLSILPSDTLDDSQDEDESPAQPKKRRVVSKSVKQISAYNTGDINQCSGDPCVSANGENICNALKLGYKRCAANFVPLGTYLEIEGYGECLVVDRMAKRFSNHVDIAFKYEEKKQALTFGRRNLEVKVIAYE